MTDEMGFQTFPKTDIEDTDALEMRITSLLF